MNAPLVVFLSCLLLVPAGCVDQNVGPEFRFRVGNDADHIQALDVWINRSATTLFHRHYELGGHDGNDTWLDFGPGALNVTARSGIYRAQADLFAGLRTIAVRYRESPATLCVEYEMTDYDWLDHCDQMRLHFAMVRLTDNVTVGPAPGPVQPACGAPVGSYAYVNWTTESIMFDGGKHTLASEPAPIVVYEALSQNASMCRFRTLFPVHVGAGSVWTYVRSREFRMSMHRDGDALKIDGRVAEPGTTTTVSVDFNETGGNRTYRYTGDLQYTFVGWWSPFGVSIIEGVPPSGEWDSVYWQYPFIDRAK